VASEQIPGVSEGDVRVVHCARPGDEPGQGRAKEDGDVEPKKPAQSHGGIIAMGGAARKSYRRGRTVVFFAMVLLAAAAVKVALISAEAFPFNADEAVVGLMARHILQGRWPTFFYGQAYMGSLDASLVALGFMLFGPQVVVIRGVQSLLYLGTVLTTMLLAMRLTGSTRASLMAGLLMAVPAVNVTLYTTVSLGGYGEMLLIGNLLLLLALASDAHIRQPWHPILWGALSGLGFWAFGLTLIYILPTGIYLFIRRWGLSQRASITKFVLPAFFGFTLGASPWIAWGLSHGPDVLLQELLGSAISGASSGSFLKDLGSNFINLILFGVTVVLGFRPPWQIRWLALPLLPFAFTAWGILFLIGARRLRGSSPKQRALRMITGFPTLQLMGFLLTPFGSDPSGRYFLPLGVFLALLAAVAFASSELNARWSRATLAILLGTHAWGTVESAFRSPPGITTQFDRVSWIDHSYDEALMQFLREQGESYGYTNYWVAYPLAFLSEEDLIYAPRLPYHQDFRYTTRDDRYEPYDDRIETSAQVAYITTNHEALDRYLRRAFTRAQLTWEEKWIGDYHVFHALSAPIRPEEMNAPWLSTP
jgi:hypothetical protein